MANPIAPLTGCLELCMSIVEHLNAAHHNKKECSSLCSVIKGIQGFLKKLPPDGLSSEGNQILVDIAATLKHSQHFLIKVGNTGPLASLLRAKDFREDLLRFNRDLSSLFNIMSSGEKLVYLHEARKQAVRTVQAELRTSKMLFSDQEMRADQLLSTAARAQQQRMHPERLNSLLLGQLEEVEEIADLSPEELLEDLYALQMEAMYDAGEGGKPKPLGSKTEEFLVQQICAAFAPKASRANKPLSPTAAAQPPGRYLCPISREIMARPVILVETGQSYDADTIKRWLDEHDTCPLTGRRLSSKQVVANYALQNIIDEWAQEQGLRWASSSTNKDDLVMIPDDAGPGGSSSSTAQARNMQGLLPTHANEAAAAPRPGSRLKIPGRACRCTRASWAVVLILLVVGVGVGVGVGIYFAKKHKSDSNVSAPPPPVTTRASAPPPPVNTSNTSDEQLEALLGIREALDNAGVLVGWNRAAGEHGGYCEWKGVDCLSGTKTIWRLNMCYCRGVDGLQGTLPSAEVLRGLPNLTFISIMSQPGLRGTLPEDWSTLTQLNYIEVGNNSLSGTIPSSYGNLASLSEFHAFGNAFSGPIPASFGSLSKLHVLGLWNNSLTGTLPSSLGQLAQLEALYLSQNSLSGPIPASFGSLSKLSKLRLDNNTLTGRIPDTLGQLRNLEDMEVNGNGLTGPIPSSLGSLSNLKTLYLFKNSLTGRIPDTLGQLQNLERMDLGDNGLTGPIPSSLGSLSKLKTLHLCRNSLTGTLPSSLGDLTQLEAFSICQNGFNGTIPASYSSMTSLKIFYPYGNPLLEGCLPLQWRDHLNTSNDVQNTGLTGFC